MIWYGSAMSQVLQCTQFDGFKLMRLPFGWLASSTISYTFAGQKFWHGLPNSVTQRSLQTFVS